MGLFDSLTIISILGTLASISGLLIALIQTIRLRELNRRDETKLWDIINTVQSLIANLENSKLVKDNTHISGSYKYAIIIHRQILKFLALREKRFTENSINRWETANKIRREWQEDQAKKLLDIPKK